MSAVPLPIKRPTYTTTVGTTFEKWLADNDEDLHAWYQATNGASNGIFDYLNFCEVQWDLEREFDERFADGLWDAALAEVDADDEVYADD